MSRPCSILLTRTIFQMDTPFSSGIYHFDGTFFETVPITQAGDRTDMHAADEGAAEVKGQPVGSPRPREAWTRSAAVIRFGKLSCPYDSVSNGKYVSLIRDTFSSGTMSIEAHSGDVLFLNGELHCQSRLPVRIGRLGNLIGKALNHGKAFLETLVSMPCPWRNAPVVSHFSQGSA